MPTAKTPGMRKLHINATAGEIAAWRKRAEWEGYGVGAWIRVSLAAAAGINPPEFRRKRRRPTLARRLQEERRHGERMLEMLRIGEPLDEPPDDPQPPAQDLPGKG